MSKWTGPAGFDAATHASVTGGEVRHQRIGVSLPSMSHNVVITPAPLRARPLGEAEAWRDGWRAAMACAVLVAETARAPAAVDLLREQLEPPV